MFKIHNNISSDALPYQAFTDFKEVELTEKMELEVAPTDTRKCWVVDMAVLPSCNLLVADWINNSVKVMDGQTGRLISQVQLPGEPYRLCLLDGDRAAVSLHDERVIQIMSISTDQLNLLDRVNVQGQCTGLAYMNNIFIVGLRDKECVASISIKGQLLKSVSEDNTGNAHFVYPDYICVTTENDAPKIYVSDYITRTITRLSEQLKVPQTFKFPTKNGPYALAAAGGGQLLVRGRDSPIYPTLLVLDTGTGVFMNKQCESRKSSVLVASSVAYCPRLGRVYVNTGNYYGKECIAVYEISSSIRDS